MLNMGVRVVFESTISIYASHLAKQSACTAHDYRGTYGLYLGYIAPCSKFAYIVLLVY